MTTTSLEALAYVTASGRLSTQRTLVGKAVARHPGRTASELDAILNIGPVSVPWWPREQQGALL